MNDLATHMGVIEEEQDEQGNQVKIVEEGHGDPREEALNAISAAYEAKLAQENAVAGIDPVREGEIVAKTNSETTPVETSASSQMVRVKIDGVEMDVPLEEVTRQYQKNSTADKRLEEASRLRREAEEYSRSIQAQPQVEVDADARELAKEHGRLMMEGDEEGAAEVLLKLTGRSNPTQAQFDVNSIIPVVKQQMLDDSALEKFNADFQDIAQDPYLEEMTAGRIKAAMAEGAPFSEAVIPAAQATRDWLRVKSGNAVKPEPTTSQNIKLERKQGIESIPAVNVRSAAPANDIELDSQSSVAEMNRSRGIGL